MLSEWDLADGLPVLADDADFELAQAALADAGLSDGLPLVPPTASRLAAMLAHEPEPRRGIDLVPPLFGELTPATIAYNAVIAGCPPDVLPLLAAAAEAMLAPEFNLLGLATTTGGAAVGMIVHGPAVAALGMNATTNCLGPGNRANATLGRALALVLRNVGGARADVGDMATVGQPAKYGFCLADAGGAPFGPLHLRRGVAAGRSAVTVLGISGTAEILPQSDAATPEDILGPVAAAMRTAVEVSGAAKQPAPPEQVFVLPPELGHRIAGHGWSLDRVQRWLFDAGGRAGPPIAPSPADIHPIITGDAGVKMAYLPLWGGGSRLVTRALR